MSFASQPGDEFSDHAPAPLATSTSSCENPPSPTDLRDSAGFASVRHSIAQPDLAKTRLKRANELPGGFRQGERVRDISDGATGVVIGPSSDPRNRHQRVRVRQTDGSVWNIIARNLSSQSFRSAQVDLQGRAKLSVLPVPKWPVCRPPVDKAIRAPRPTVSPRGSVPCRLVPPCPPPAHKKPHRQRHVARTGVQSQQPAPPSAKTTPRERQQRFERFPAAAAVEALDPAKASATAAALFTLLR
eukprot:Hpha_TRINITY_DN9329_c0_g2::TRINITY_DN9329_c0_g2_i1::g.26007::m.26007